MPASVTELLELLDLEAVEDNLFRGRQPHTQMQRVFGGQVLAQAVVAAVRTISEEYAVHSLHSYFLRPGNTAVPIVYDVETLREGRSFATRRVAARQHGRSIFYMTANFQRPEQGLEHQDEMPVVPPPEDCPAATERSGRPANDAWLREWAALEVCKVADSRPGGALVEPGTPARSQWWIRIAGELPADHLSQTAAFTYASDMTLLPATLVPHDLYIESEGMQAASLDHSIWFHRPFRSDEWWLYDQASQTATGGRGLATARVFSRDGRLVASVAQEGLIRHRQTT